MSITKEIILTYKDEFEIPIQINNNNKYNEIYEIIRKKIFLTKDEMKSITIQFIDTEGDPNILDKDNFKEAFESEKWLTTYNTDNAEKKIDEKVINNFITIMEKKLKENNEMWKKYLDKIENKYKKEIEQREIVYKNIIKEITKNMSVLAKDNLEKKIKEYNGQINEIMNSKIKESILKLNNENNNVQKDIENINKTQNNIKQNIEISKINFGEFISKSKVNILDENNNNNNYNQIIEDE